MTTKRIEIKLGELDAAQLLHLLEQLGEAGGPERGDEPAADVLDTVHELAEASKALRRCRTLLVDAACDADCGEDGADEGLGRAHNELVDAQRVVAAARSRVDGHDTTEMLCDALWRIERAAGAVERARYAVEFGDGPRAARIAGAATEDVLAACGLLTFAAVAL